MASVGGGKIEDELVGAALQISEVRQEAKALKISLEDAEARAKE